MGVSGALAEYEPELVTALHLLQGLVRSPVALAGVILPLLMIGGMKFTAVEIAALKPLIGGTPWLAWMYPVFGEAGASYVLGVVEITTGLLLLASPWSYSTYRGS